MSKISKLMFITSCSALAGVSLFTGQFFLNKDFSKKEVANASAISQVGGFYQIENAEQLKVVANSFLTEVASNYQTAKIELVADVDLKESFWTPIGTSSNAFKGEFNGNGFTISNSISTGMSSKDGYQGLFGYVQNAEIYDLVIEDFSYAAEANAETSGVLAGYVGDSIIAGVYDNTTSALESVGTVESTAANNSKIYKGNAHGESVSESFTIKNKIGTVEDGFVATFINEDILELNHAHSLKVEAVNEFSVDVSHTTVEGSFPSLKYFASVNPQNLNIASISVGDEVYLKNGKTIDGKLEKTGFEKDGELVSSKNSASFITLLSSSGVVADHNLSSENVYTGGFGAVDFTPFKPHAIQVEGAGKWLNESGVAVSGFSTTNLTLKPNMRTVKYGLQIFNDEKGVAGATSTNFSTFLNKDWSDVIEYINDAITDKGDLIGVYVDSAQSGLSKIYEADISYDASGNKNEVLSENNLDLIDIKNLSNAYGVTSSSSNPSVLNYKIYTQWQPVSTNASISFSTTTGVSSNNLNESVNYITDDLAVSVTDGGIKYTGVVAKTDTTFNTTTTLNTTTALNEAVKLYSDATTSKDFASGKVVTILSERENDLFVSVEDAGVTYKGEIAKGLTDWTSQTTINLNTGKSVTLKSADGSEKVINTTATVLTIEPQTINFNATDRKITLKPGLGFEYFFSVPYGHIITSIEDESDNNINYERYGKVIVVKRENPVSKDCEINIEIERELVKIDLEGNYYTATLSENSAYTSIYTSIDGTTIKTYIGESFDIDLVPDNGFELEGYNCSGITTDDIDLDHTEKVLTVENLKTFTEKNSITFYVKQKIFNLKEIIYDVEDYKLPQDKPPLGKPTFTLKATEGGSVTELSNGITIGIGSGTISFDDNDYYIITGVSMKASEGGENLATKDLLGPDASLVKADGSDKITGSFNNWTYSGVQNEDDITLTVTLKKRIYDIKTVIQALDIDGYEVSLGSDLATGLKSTYSFSDERVLSYNIISNYYELEGWYLNNSKLTLTIENKYTFNTTGDKELTLKLKGKTKTIMLNSSGVIIRGQNQDSEITTKEPANSDKINQVTYLYGVNPPTFVQPTYKGHSLLGYQIGTTKYILEENTSDDFSTMIKTFVSSEEGELLFGRTDTDTDTNIVLTPIITPYVLTVNYKDVNGGLPKTQTFEYGASSYIYFPNPDKIPAGEIFVGWSYDEITYETATEMKDVFNPLIEDQNITINFTPVFNELTITASDVSFDYCGKEITSVEAVFESNEFVLKVKHNDEILATVDLAVKNDNTPVNDSTALTDVTFKSIIVTAGLVNGNAGSYKIVKIIDKVETDLCSLTINQKSVEVFWADVDYTYDGGIIHPTAKFVDISGTDVGLTVTTTMSNGNIGTYTATATTTNPNYALTNTTKEYTIVAKSVEVVWADADSYIYSGSVIEPTASFVNVGGENVSLTVATTMSNGNIGTYTATATTTNPNYTLTNTTYEYEITARELTSDTWNNADDNLYSSVNKYPTINFTNVESGDSVAVTYEYKLKTAEDSGYSETEPTMLGVYNVRVKSVDNSNYSLPTEKFTEEFKIIAGFSSTSFLYVDDTTTREITVTIEDIEENKDLVLTLQTNSGASGEYSFANSNLIITSATYNDISIDLDSHGVYLTGEVKIVDIDYKSYTFTSSLIENETNFVNQYKNFTITELTLTNGTIKNINMGDRFIFNDAGDILAELITNNSVEVTVKFTNLVESFTYTLTDADGVDEYFVGLYNEGTGLIEKLQICDGTEQAGVSKNINADADNLAENTYYFIYSRVSAVQISGDFVESKWVYPVIGDANGLNPFASEPTKAGFTYKGLKNPNAVTLIDENKKVQSNTVATASAMLNWEMNGVELTSNKTITENTITETYNKDGSITITASHAAENVTYKWFKQNDLVNEIFSTALLTLKNVADTGVYVVEAVMGSYSVTKEITVTINRATQTIDVSGVQTEYTYKGIEQIINSGATVADTEQTVEYSNNTFTTVAQGNGMVITVSVAESENYTAISTTVMIEVEKATQTIDVSGVQTEYTYTASEQIINSGAMVADTEQTVEYSNNTFTTVAQGDGMVITISVAETANYNAISITVTIEVKKAVIDELLISKIYDGNASFSVSLNKENNAQILGDDVIDIEGAFTQKQNDSTPVEQAGEKDVNVTSITGADNYIITAYAGEITAISSALFIEVKNALTFDFANKTVDSVIPVYNEGESAWSIQVKSGTTILAQSDISLYYNNNGITSLTSGIENALTGIEFTFPANTKNASTYEITVVGQGSFSNEARFIVIGESNAEKATTSLVINKKSVDVVWTNVDYTYNGGIIHPTAKIVDVDSNDVNCDIATTMTTKNIGSYTATASINDTINYELTESTKNYTITPKQITLSGMTKEFNGTRDFSQTFDHDNFVEIVDGDTVVVTGEFAKDATAEEITNGTSINLIGLSSTNKNYSFAATGTGVITKNTTWIIAVQGEFEFTYGDVIDFSELTIKNQSNKDLASYVDKTIVLPDQKSNSGNLKASDEKYDIQINLTSNFIEINETTYPTANKNLADALKINKKEVVITISSPNKLYDGMSAVAGYSVGDRVSGDLVSVDGVNYASSSTGTHAFDPVISGVDKDNYSFVCDPIEGTISSKIIEIKVVGKTNGVFVSDGNTNDFEQTINNYNEEIELSALNNPARTGYEFKGWFEDESLQTALTKEKLNELLENSIDTDGNVLADITLYAKFDIKTYNVTVQMFDINDNVVNWGSFITNPTSNSQTGNDYNFNYYTNVVITPTANDNYVLVSSENLNIANISQTETAKIIFRPVNLVVAFDIPNPVHSNVEGDISSINLNYETLETISLPTLTAQGYEFKNWSYNDGITDINFPSARTLKQIFEEINGSAIYADGYEITLKALWSAKAFDITYQANGGEFGDEEPSKTENIVSTTFATELNTATNYLTPSREGYTFKGWKHIEQGQENDFAEDAVFKTAAQMTLVAKWDQDIYEISVTTTDNSKVDNISMVQGDQITNGTIDGGIYKFNVYSLTNYKIKITMQNGFGIEGLTANGNDYISEEKQFTVSETFNYIVEALTRDMTFTTQFVDSLKITISDDNIFTDTDTVIDISKTDNTTAGRAENEFAFTVNVGKFIKVVATAQKGYSADHRNTSLVQGSNTGFDKENKDYVILSGFVDNCKFKLNATPESYIVTITKGAGVESFEIISGAINDNGDLKVTTGIPFKFKAIYSHGYEKAEVSSLTSGTAGTVENTDFAEITVSGFNEAFSLSVSAEKKDFNVQYGAYFIDNNRLVVSEETDNVSVEQNGQPVTTAEFESHVSFKANGVEGYNIVGWFLAEDLEVDSNILYYNVGEVKNVDNVQVLDNIKYIAVFKQQVWSLKASAKDREGTFKVSISSSEEEAFNEYNETLGSGVAYSIEAVANSGYEFLEWQNENGDFVSANPIYAGTLTDNTERIAVFNPKQGKINISVNMYLNGIPQPERKTIYGEIIAGTWNGTIFTAGDTGLNGAELNPVTGYAENDFKFLTDQDLFIKIVVKNGYEFINILSVEGEKDIANIQSVENGIEGDNTYHIYRISNLNADNNYSDAEVRVDGEENELNIIFVDNEGTRVNAGGIYVDVLEEPGVTSIIRTGGKGSSNVSVWAYTGSYIEIKAYTKFDFDISNDQTIVGDGISYTFTKPLDEEVSQENGFTSLITIKIENINSDFINENAIKIKTVTTEYEIYLMDNKRKIAEISGVRNGHCFNIPEEINQAIINLIADKSAIGLSLKGFNTAINGGGTQYVFFNSSSSKWDCFKEWDSHPYQFNGNEYEFAPNFEIVEENGQKKGVFKIYASWIQLKSNIEIFTSPETLRAEPPTVKAGEVIQTLNSVNSWVNSNDPFVADMLYGADIKIKAPTYKGYKFKNWIITYGSKEEIIETQVYEKKGGFGVESVTMTAIYSPRFEISSTNGGSAKLVQGGLEIINGTADYIENHRDITLVVEPLSGFKFDGWYIKGTNDLFVNLLDHSITIDGKDFTETSLEARFSGKDIQIFVADYDDSQGKIFSVYRGEELLFGEDESGTLITHSPFEATVGEILEITIQVNQGFDGKSGVFWNDLTGINFKTRYDKGVYEYLVYNYVIKGEDLKEGLGESDLDYITLYPEIVEQKIKIVFDITFEGSDEFAVAGSVNLDELENGIALVSYGKEVLINISVNKNYKIESIVFNGLSYLMKLEDGVLPLPSSAFSETLGDNISYTLRIKFAKAMWINETMSESLKGNGTKENPYIIGSTNDLILILNKVNVEKDEQYQNAHYRLEKDINLNGKFWTPIGTELFPFNGFVVLSGFRFTNLTLDPDHVGVTTFGNVFGATGEDFKIVETDNALIIIIATISSAVLIVIIVLSAVFISKRVKKNKLDDLATGQYKDN